MLKYAKIASLFILAGSASAQCNPMWQPLPDISQIQGIINTSIIWNNNLIVAGSFPFGPYIHANIAKWDGNYWHSLGRGFDSSITSLAILPNGNLVAGGGFQFADEKPANLIAQWDGVSWQSLNFSTNVVNSNSYITCLTTLPNGNLVAAGRLFVYGIDPIFQWDGKQWLKFGSGISGKYNIYALAVLKNGDLIAGGSPYSYTGNGMDFISRWNGSSWLSLGNSMDGPVNSMVVMPNGNLIAGGGFVHIGNNIVNNIASWDGVTWSSLGSGIPYDYTYPVSDLAVLPSGDLIVSGNFSQAGGVAANGMARWDGSWHSMIPSGFQNLIVLSNNELVSGNLKWVENPHLLIVNAPQSMNIRIGNILSLSSSCSSGFKGVSYRWMRNNRNILNGPGGASPGGGTVINKSGLLSDGDVNARLIIQNFQASDAGQYSVIFDNSCGPVTSIPAIISFTCIGDLNYDGQVDDSDFSLFLFQYDIFACNDPTMLFGCNADLNSDSLVDDADFSIFVIAYDQLICSE